MKLNYTWMTIACLVLAVPLAINLMHRRSSQAATPVARFATFNASLFRERQGAMLEELRQGNEQAARIAEIVQRCEVDVLLLCELDRDDAEATARLFAERYLARSHNGQRGIVFDHIWCGPSNTGEPSGMDLDGDGRSDGPADAFGYGRFPGQYAMALFSRHPILVDEVRTFRKLPWHKMPAALRPDGVYDDDTWSRLRLSSKSHWDVPIGIGSRVVHALCSHPTPPAFDGPEDRYGRRNHDEIRFWVDYLTPDRAGWIVDDTGRAGGLPDGEAFVLLGDLNCDPQDGEARREALLQLLAHPRVQDPLPKSAGGPAAASRQGGRNTEHRGDPALDTADFGDFASGDNRGPGNLRVDYVLPARSLQVFRSAVFWPQLHDLQHALVTASDHRLVWVDVDAR